MPFTKSLLLGLLIVQSAAGAVAQQPSVTRAPTPTFAEFSARRREEVKERCKNGDSISCREAADAYRLPKSELWPLDPNPVLAGELFIKSCEVGEAPDCSKAGWALLFDDNVNHDQVKGNWAFEKGCKDGDRRACRAIQKMKAMSSSPHSNGEKLEPLGNFCAEDWIPSPGHEKPPLPDVFVVTDTPPKLISQSQPVYPKKMKRSGTEGKVILELVINEQGSVIDARITRSDDQGFNQSAMEAVKTRKYEPAVRCGVPVKTYKSVTIVYRLHD